VLRASSLLEARPLYFAPRFSVFDGEFMNFSPERLEMTRSSFITCRFDAQFLGASTTFSSGQPYALLHSLAEAVRRTLLIL